MQCNETSGRSAERTLWRRELLPQLAHAAADMMLDRFVLGMGKHLADPAGNVAHLRLAQAARRQRRRADADARRIERRTLIERDLVLVDGDGGGIKRFFRLLTAQAARGDVDEQKVIVGAPGDEAEAEPRQLMRERLGVGDDLGSMALELRLE